MQFFGSILCHVISPQSSCQYADGKQKWISQVAKPLRLHTHTEKHTLSSVHPLLLVAQYINGLSIIDDCGLWGSGGSVLNLEKARWKQRGWYFLQFSPLPLKWTTPSAFIHYIFNVKKKKKETEKTEKAFYSPSLFLVNNILWYLHRLQRSCCLAANLLLILSLSCGFAHGDPKQPPSQPPFPFPPMINSPIPLI